MEQKATMLKGLAVRWKLVGEDLTVEAQAAGARRLPWWVMPVRFSDEVDGLDRPLRIAQADLWMQDDVLRGFGPGDVQVELVGELLTITATVTVPSGCWPVGPGEAAVYPIVPDGDVLYRCTVNEVGRPGL